MREIVRSIRVTLILWLIAAVLYPLTLLGIGQVAFSFPANGSLMTNSQGNAIGSALIGQSFTTDSYFWSRPSAINYSSFSTAEVDPKSVQTIAGLSGASNLAPSNPELFRQVQKRIETLQIATLKPTADLVYASASGLDPHISIEAARGQISRLARVRSLNPNQLEMLIAQNTEGRFLGIFGEPGVNVLKANLALDKLSRTARDLTPASRS